MSDATPTPITKRALGRVFALLNRADELGGEVRDFVQEKVLRDERYIAMRRRIERRRSERAIFAFIRSRGPGRRRSASRSSARPTTPGEIG